MVGIYDVRIDNLSITSKIPYTGRGKEYAFKVPEQKNKNKKKNKKIKYQDRIAGKNNVFILMYIY